MVRFSWDQKNSSGFSLDRYRYRSIIRLKELIQTVKQQIRVKGILKEPVPLQDKDQIIQFPTAGVLAYILQGFVVQIKGLPGDVGPGGYFGNRDFRTAFSIIRAR